MRNRAEEEIGNGRLWRAKEILRGRLADADYDPELFAQYAGVLAAMRDDDEAGRFHLLAGQVDGAAGALARAFLVRRSAVAFAQLWSSMPVAARRGTADRLPAGTLDLLREAGFAPQRIEAHLAGLKRQGATKRAARKRRMVDLAAAARGETVGLVMAALLLVILSVGVVGTLRLLWWGLATVLGAL